MPSFVVANPICKLAQSRALARRFDIQVSSYQVVKNTEPPVKSEFQNLLRDFDLFCKEIRGQNKDKKADKPIKCDMFMLTGYHGNYTTHGGILNNLNQGQLAQLVQKAQKYNINFKHIVTDACCSAFGLKHLEGMLANGGEAIGDRMTSTAFRAHDKLMEQMASMSKVEVEGPWERDETLKRNEKLINQVIEETLCTFNAPIYVTKLGPEIKTVGTEETEVRQIMIRTYKDSGLIDTSLSDQDAEQALRDMGLGPDLDLMPEDLRHSCALFPAIKEIAQRDQLLQLRKLHHFVADYLIKGMHMDKINDTRNIGLFRLQHSEGIKLIQKIDKYLSGKPEEITPVKTQDLIGQVNQHIKMNFRKDSATSISKSMPQL